MKSWKMVGFLALVLTTLAGGAAATLGGEEAAAVPCCTRGCDYGYDRCVRHCDPEISDDCELYCLERYLPCYANCEISC